MIWQALPRQDYYNLFMPPKKDGKKQALSKPDNSGIAKQDVEFKCVLTVRSDAPEAPNYAVMFEWFGNLSDKMERYETPLLESWKKQQNSYSFEKEFDLLRVDDDFCKALSGRQFFLYFVNPDDGRVEDQLLLDYSCLLAAAEGQPKFSFESNTVKAFGVDSFSLSLTADKPLLGEVYRHFLNPLEVEVIGAKDLPVEKSSKYEPAYIRYQFFNGEVAQTQALVGADKLLWSHRHVFLLGLMNSTQLKEKMRSNYLKFELHDRDELNSKKLKADVEVFDIGRAIQEEMEKEKPVEEDPKKKGQAKKEDKKEVKKEAKKEAKKKEAKLGEPVLPPKKEILSNNYGVSACSLVEFLKPTMRNARYKIPVVPRNTFEDFESRNIDLNTTARNEMQKVIASNNYFDCDTVLVVGFTLAHPIGTFVKPPKEEQPQVEDPKKKKDAKEPPKEAKEVAAEKEEKEPSKDVFERVVYIVPYKDAASVRVIEEIFYAANQKAFGLKSRREITTHLLSAQEQGSRSLDYVTGFELADPEGRIYILEGLRSGAVQEFHQRMLRKAPNSKEFKIFKNSSICFSQRLFAGFHLELKRIRLRPSLAQLLLEPSIYIKSKVPEEISQNLNKLADLRKICDDLATAEAMNLWPDAHWLVQIERKFSQSLSPEDLTGEEAKPQKRDTGGEGEASRTIRLLENTDLKVVTADEFFLPKIAPAAETSPFQQTGLGETANRRAVLTKTFTKDAGKTVAQYQMRGRAAEVGEGEAVYIYAGQSNNFYEKKLRELREEMRRNPQLIYTYNKDFFRLAIDPCLPEEEARKERELSLSKMYSKDKFSSLLVRTKDERLRLPNRLPEEDAEDIRKYPYHEEKAREREMKRNVRDQPPSNGSQDFKKYIKRQEVFSEYPPVDGERLSPVEQERLEREQRQRFLEEERKKLKGDPVVHVKKGYFGEKAYGADRFKDIREGETHKLGLVDYSKREKAKRPVETLEVSYNLRETPGDPSFNPLVRVDDPSQNIQKEEFNFYQGPEVLTRTQVYKPLKDPL